MSKLPASTEARYLQFGRREISAGWRWRTARADFLHPSDMETSHLFHTFRMIWNNFMPKEAQVGEVKLYRFGVQYTDDYLSEAVVALGRELGRRSDLTPEQRRQLSEMAGWFASYEAVPPDRLPRHQKALTR